MIHGQSGAQEHYFVREPAVPSQPRTVRQRIAGFDLVFTTDRGVFSHGRVDKGTLLLAETMEIPDGARVLDLGCGYGVLGVVAALLCPTCKVTMVDINARACRLAEENAHANGIAQVEVVCGDAREVLAGREFDVILTNPPCRAGRELVLSLFEWVAGALSREGAFWCVIQTKKGARRYGRDLGQWFEQVETVDIKAGYRIFKATHPRGAEQDQSQE